MLDHSYTRNDKVLRMPEWINVSLLKAITNARRNAVACKAKEVEEEYLYNRWQLGKWQQTSALSHRIC